MKISVVIPTFNRAHVLERAIDSVFEQTFQDFELLIVDDGSTDNTQELLEKRYAGESKLRYLKMQNRGVSAARNLGVVESKGEWIALLDSDDEWLPQRLEKQWRLLERRPDLKLIHGEEIWIRRGRRVNPKKIHQKFGGVIFEKCLPLCLISPSAVLIKKTLFDEIGLFDEEFIVCEDYDLWLRITSLYPVGFVEEPIIIKYGGHRDQLSARFKAMDYWRVRSLERILETRSLERQTRMKVVEEILKKASLLERGYIKHSNLKNLVYIQGLLERFST